MPHKQTKLSPEEALAALEELALDNSDPELQHIQGDVIICQLLNFLGQEEVADQYTAMQRNWDHA